MAQQVGLPGVLAHGMLTMGLAVQPVIDRFGAAAIREYGVRFTKPVPVPPDGGVVLDVTAKIGKVDEEAGTLRVDLSASVDGTVVLGRAQVVVGIR